MCETDDDFKPALGGGGYDYLVDFLDLSFPHGERPGREHAYVDIRNRMGVMRHVVLNGLLWDDLYIGFQNRISREPDVYHHRFWNHFQTQLPVTRPSWTQFLGQAAGPETRTRTKAAELPSYMYMYMYMDGSG